MKRIAAVLILCLLLSHGKVYAQVGDVTVNNNDAEISFPTSIRFSVDLRSTNTIEKVLLHYGSVQDSCGNVSAIAFPEVTPDKNVSVQWEWDMRQSGGEPPGATIWWQWEVIDGQGVSQMTDREEILWLDDIHPWQELSEGMIRLHYYYDDETYADSLLNAAVTAIDRLKQDIGMSPDQPINLYIYENTEDMTDAIFYEPGWTGGQAYPSYNIVIIGIEPYNIDWGMSTEGHEITHILEGDYTFSCLGGTPTWLSEGLAVYGEGGPREDWISLFDRSVGDDTLLTFKVLSGGFSEDAAVADLSYSQSYYMVNYLIQNYGKEKMLEFLDAIKSGEELNNSLQQTYGFDLTGFENEWRASLGLSPNEVDAAQSTPVPTIIPTIVPIQGAQTWEYHTSTPEVFAPTPAPTSTDSTITDTTKSTPEPDQGNFIQKINQMLGKWMPIILIFIAVSSVLLVIVLIIIRRKGDRA